MLRGPAVGIGLVLALVFLVPHPCAAEAPSEVWASESTPSGGVVIPRGKTIIWELYGNLGVQEGVVLGGEDLRAPLSVKPLVGFNFIQIGSTRLLLGVTMAFPFSLEMGWGTDMAQLALAPGVTISRRECANWGWFAGIEVPLVITPERLEGSTTEVLAGLGLRGGAAWYFLAGLGIYAEANVDLYFGEQNAAVLGVTGGLVLSWEMYRFKPGVSEPAGGTS